MNANISVTGDCQSTGSGAISLLINSGSPPYTVQWVSPSLGTDVITFQPSIRTSLNSDTYIVTVNDSTLPVNQTLNINIPVSSGVCANILGVQGTTCSLDNGSVTGTSSSNYSTTDFYLYDSNDNFITLQTTNINVNDVIFGGLSAGTYYMQVVDIGGCTGYSQNFIIEDSSPLDFGIYNVPNSSCGGTPIGKLFVTGVTGSPPYSYIWSNGATGSTITGLTSGAYSVTVTDSLGCSQTEGVNVVDVPQVGLGTFTAVPPSCFAADGSITIQITGGTTPYYYSASTGAVAIQYGTSFTLSGLSAGNYLFQVTDAALCSFVAGTSLASPQGMTSVSINTNGSTCSSSDGSIQVSVVGGVTPYIYTLIYPNGNTSNITGNQTVQIFPSLSSGTYSVAVQDSSSCSYMEEVTLTKNATFTTSTNTTSPTCNQNNGSILVIRSEGGAQPYTYSMDGVQIFSNTTLSAVTFSNVNSGQHTITVTDGGGCVQTTQVNVSSSNPLDFALYSTSCGSGFDGKISALISSGEPPFTFYWSNNIPSNPQNIQVSGLSAGTYSLTVVDSVGCSLSRSVPINCDKLYVSYQTYVMGGEDFIIKPQSKYGILQMLNEGFNDLTIGKVGCKLNSAIFGVEVSVIPLGLSTSETFFTGTTLTSVPTDELYCETIKDLLLTIPGIGEVTFNLLENQIIINTEPGDTTLINQRIIIELVIVYDISCLECGVDPFNFDITANWGLVGVTNQATFVAWLTSLGATSVNITAFSLNGGRLQAAILVNGVIALNLNNAGVTLVNKVGGLTGLENLLLSDNNIVTFNPSIALPTSLTLLNLIDNNIVTFNPSIALPTSLTQLNLIGNQIVTFNPSIALPTSLNALGLGDNQIVTFNPSIALPTSLNLLGLGDNQIVTFNPSIALPTSLLELQLSDNNIVTFNPSIALPTSLNVLGLSSNNIVTFNPSIALPTSLIELQLSDNNITTFNPSIALPTSLNLLGLGGNQIVTFNPSIALPNSLEGLDLTGNLIVTFNPSITLPTSLILLGLSGNNIVTFNPTISLPNSLEVLDLTGNLMTTAGYTNSEPWANAQTPFTSLCTIVFTANVNSITGTNLEVILISKNCSIIP